MSDVRSTLGPGRRGVQRFLAMQSSDGAIEELNWVPALCHRRQQSTEQTHMLRYIQADTLRVLRRGVLIQLSLGSGGNLIK